MWDLEQSMRRAEERLQGLGDRHAGRRRRSDRGRFRMEAGVERALVDALSGQEQPPMEEVLRGLAAQCTVLGARCPSRATLYHFMAAGTGRLIPMGDLPAPVRRCLYNLDGDARIPGHQVAFHAFNDGDLGAVMFAAGMPWLDLYRAARMRGWRPRSRGLLRAVQRVRRIG